MPVPNSMADLSTLASSNFPTGTESIGNSLDNYLRAISAIVRSDNAIASSSIASASTTDIGAADAEHVFITGSTTINSFGPGFPGCKRHLQFTAQLTIVNSGVIALPSGTNLVVAAGEVHEYRCISSGVWRLVGGQTMLLAGKMGTAGDQTLNGGFLITANGTLPTTAGSSSNTARYRVETANVDELRSFYFRTTNGSGWESAEHRVQRVVDGAAFRGYIAHKGGATDIIGFGYAFQEVVTISQSGNVTATGNLISLSDEAVKTNWGDLGEDFVERLAGVKYGTYDRTDIDASQVGVSAQSLQAVLPAAVNEGTDGRLSVVYGNAALVGVIALAQRVVELEKRLAA